MRRRRRLCFVRQLGSQRRLMLAARAQQDAKHRLDLAARKPHRFGAVAAVFEDLALALHIADAKAVLALVRRDLTDERHPAHDDLEEVAVEHVDHGAQDGKRPRSGVVDHDSKLSATVPRRYRSRIHWSSSTTSGFESV